MDRNIINEVIDMLSKNESLFTKIINNIYFFISFFFQYYYKKIEINNVSLDYHKINTMVISNNLIVCDHCIIFNELVIPYEYILLFGGNKSFFIKFLGKIDFLKDCLKLNVSADDIVTINFDTNNSKKLKNLIRKNMEYHIKFHTLNESVVLALIKKEI